MATDIKKVITIETGEGERSVKSLKQEISTLKDALLNVKEGGEDWEKIVKQLTQAQSDLDKVTKAGKQSIDAAKDSIVGMEREYKTLYNTYKLLSDEQRNSDFGKNMAKSLNELSEKLNTTKKEVGNFKDNIGHYTESAMQAFSQMGISVGALQGPMKLATAASKGLGASLKALIANPVGAVIMAIVVAFKALGAILGKVKEAIQQNEETQMRLKEAMSAFQPVIDGVKKGFDWLAKAVVSVVEYMAKAVNSVRTAIAAFTDFLGITKGAKEEMQAQQEAYAQLAKSQNELIKTKREYQKLNATDKAEVERLREEASETDDLVKKRQLLNEAKAKQAAIDERNIALAQKDLEIKKAQAALNPNSTSDNDALAEAEAKVSEAIAQAAANARMFNKQLAGTNKVVKETASDATKEIEKELKAVDDILKRIDDNNKTEIQKLEEKYNEEKALLEKYGKDTTELTAQFEANKTKIIDAEAKKRADALAKRAALEAQLSNSQALYAGANPEDIKRRTLESQKSQLEAEIELAEEGSDAKIELQIKYFDTLAELRRMDLDDEKKKHEDEIKLLKERQEKANEWADATQNLLGAVSDAWEESINQRVKSGKINEEQAKKEFKAVKGMQIAVATINMLQGITSALAGVFTTKTGPWDIALAAAQAASIGISGGANIAKIAATEYGGSTTAAVNSVPSVSTTPVIADTNPYSYSRSLTTEQEEEQMNRPIWISVKDMEDGLNKAEVRDNETSF